MKRISLILSCLILVVACESSSSESKSKQPAFNRAEESSLEKSDGGAHMNFAPPQVSAGNSTPIKASQLKLLKSAQLELKTQGIEHAKFFIDRILAKNDGYYGNESFDKSNYEASYDLTIRVPSANFSRFLAQLSHGPIKLISKSVETKDVSDDYADTEARITSKRAYLKRYQELLGKAKNVTELLEMEEQIRQLIEEIEAAESKLKHYDSFVSFSKIHVRLFQPFKVPEPIAIEEPGFWSQLGDSLAGGWHGIERFIISLFRAWPSLLIFLGIIYFFKKPLGDFFRLIRGIK